MPHFPPCAKYSVKADYSVPRNLIFVAKNNKQPQTCEAEQEQLFLAPDLFPHPLAAPSSPRGGDITAEFPTGGSKGIWECSKAVPESGETHPAVTPGAVGAPSSPEQPPKILSPLWHWLSVSKGRTPSSGV